MATLKDLMTDLSQYQEPDFKVVVQLVGNEFADGDLLEIDSDCGVGFNSAAGAVVIMAVSNEPGD